MMRHVSVISLALPAALLAGCVGEIRTEPVATTPGSDAGIPTDGARPLPGQDAALRPPESDSGRPPADASAADAATPPPDSSTPPPEPDAGTVAGACPASGPVHIERWWTSPWVAPASGDAEQVVELSRETGLHYARAVIAFEFETDGDIEGDWTHIGVLRNRAIPSGWPHLAWYGWLLHRNIPREQIQVALDGCQRGGEHSLKPNTTYQLTYDYDATAATATITLEEIGGGTVSATCPVSSSLVPVGRGLFFYLGMRTSHRDYPTVQPPSGWTFRNFVADLTPGGPLGPDAPPCP